LAKCAVALPHSDELRYVLGIHALVDMTTTFYHTGEKARLAKDGDIVLVGRLMPATMVTASNQTVPDKQSR
jgi:hypothetical protein